MSLPTATDVGTLDYVYLAAPANNAESKSGQDTGSLDYVYLASPFFGAPSGAVPPPAYNATQFFMVFF